MQPVAAQEAGSGINKINEGDHVYGDPEAKITLIEYSDFGCHFCGVLHPRMVSLIDKNPNVKWVYRHYAIRDRESALASECVATLGGEDAFWNFSNHAFENQGGLDMEKYLELATAEGVDGVEFTACLEEERYAEKVDGDYLNGQLSGVRGTPHTVVVTPDGLTIPFSGAQPEEAFQTLIDQLEAKY